MDQGRSLENEDKQSCHSCMQHFALTCFMNLPSIIKIFQTAAEMCSGNEVKTWVKGHNKKMNISRVVILASDSLH